uniref:Uncharacterized protein n=1 Tax=Pararge aegeria TaxID=116150 RepID=S4P8I7_9NEOP
MSYLLEHSFPIFYGLSSKLSLEKPNQLTVWLMLHFIFSHLHNTCFEVAVQQVLCKFQCYEHPKLMNNQFNPKSSDGRLNLAVL